jgi:hypothetical protein
MTGGEFFVLVLTVVVGGIVAAIVGLVRFLFRAGGVGARRVAAALSRPSHTLFGPTGPPEELCRRLVQKHAALGPGVHGGLSFSGSGCRGRLDFISDRTEIRFALDDRGQPALEVSTASVLSQIAEDDPEAFRVRGSEELYRRIFAGGAPARMLRDWGVPFEWTLGASTFTLLIHGLPGDEEKLWRWLKGAFRLLQAIPGFEDDAPIQIPSVSAYSAAEGECQVCGVTLGQGTVVRCRRCATPHHEDCWAYTGECSTFACKERNWIR